jgi:preprotein translocase subunit SecE
MSKDLAEHSDSVGWVETTRQYLNDVWNERTKITWPQRKEAVAGTIGVIIIVAIITLVLGLIDVALAELVKWVLP